MVIGIPGVDEHNFQNIFEGDTELYVTILRIFTGKTPDVLASLRNVSQATLPDYLISIHALKGACANICAEEARKMAVELETMAKAGDLFGLPAANEAFLLYMENLLVVLQNWLNNR
jgi:HPt (histidine-containing phosphotransfer) domain-containing protein